MRRINKNIIRLLSDKTKCPILEMFYSNEDNHWYVCFEEYTFYEGKEQNIHIDDLLNELEKFDNIEFLSNEIFEDKNNYFEQVSFQWEE